VTLLSACLFSVALGGEIPPTATYAAPTPILEWAERDVSASKGARLAVAVSFAAPGMLFVGQLAARSFRGTSDGGYAAGLALLSLGTAGSTVGPAVLFVENGRSRAALRGQGLAIGRVRTWLGAPLLAASVGTVGYLSIAYPGAFDEHRTPLLLGVSAYAGALFVGIVDSAANQAARRHAGWLGAVPTFSGRSAGIALAGQW
jgi:hypothetical protein